MNSARLYRADPRHAELGDDFLDVVEAATFPRLELRYRNDRWAELVGLGALAGDEWPRLQARWGHRKDERTRLFDEQNPI